MNRSGFGLRGGSQDYSDATNNIYGAKRRGVMPFRKNNQIYSEALWKQLLAPAGWWDFSDRAQLTITSSALQTCLDKSGNGRTMTQGTAGNRPAYNTSAPRFIGPYMCPDWDGSTDFLLASGYGITRPWSCIAVCRPDSGAQMAIASRSGQPLVFAINNGKIGYNWGGTGGAFNAGMAMVPHNYYGIGGIFGIAYDAASTVKYGAYMPFQNDGSRAVATTQIRNQSYTTTAGSVAMEIGRRSGGNFFDGCIGEVITWDRQITEAEFGQTFEYLAHKWRLYQR